MAFVATKGLPLATTITGSLPRPRWFVGNLDGRPFLTAFAGDPVYREQYCDAVAALIADQTQAGLDVVSDGEMRFDIDIGGRSWGGYVLDRLGGVRTAHPGSEPSLEATGGTAARADVAGSIFSEIIKRRSEIVGPPDAGSLQYDAVWKTAQRLTSKPVKMGSCSAQLLESQLTNHFHPDRHASVTALSQALNAEYHRLADAGCAAIQVEEPSLHNASGRKRELSIDDYVTAFNVEVGGLRAKTEVWCHICWGNPFAQRLAKAPTLKPMLPYVDGLDVDVVTFETAENGCAEIAEIAAAIGKDKKICIGVVRHRSLQVETPDEVAALIRTALEYIEPERLIVGSDCGFGRQGMSRVHAFYKMVATVRGANLVRRELGLPQASVVAADSRFMLS
jgi:5-methyltetrahydropteroyltriglutamate--homocysteine methyltransferase